MPATIGTANSTARRLACVFMGGPLGHGIRHRQQPVPGRHATSPCLIPRVDVILGLHDRVAREPALGVVRLRGTICRCPRLERLGRRVIVKRGVPHPPSGNRLASFTMKSTSCWVVGTTGWPGSESFTSVL